MVSSVKSRGRPENQGTLTRGFPEEVKTEPKPGKGDERKKRSVFHAEAAECAETQRQESSPWSRNFKKFSVAGHSLGRPKRAKVEAGNRLFPASLHAGLRSLSFMGGQ